MSDSGRDESRDGQKYFDSSQLASFQGLVFTDNYEVRAEWTASEMGSGEVPVLSTPALILACERTAFRALRHLIKDDRFTSVGSKVEILHTAPCRVGETFRVEAMITQIHRSFVTFTINVSVGERIIATGLHRRHIVNKEEFLRKVREGNPRNLR